jgi:tryptophan-rich sensory protein
MKKRPILTLLLSIAIAEGVGLLSGLLAGDSGAVYQTLNQPPLAPPGWVFPVAWAILYALMGLAAGLIYLNNGNERAKEQALTYYILQLAVNFSWSIIFFQFQAFGLAVAVILLLDLLVIMTMRRFFAISKAAGWLLVPYLAWLLFATYLAIGVSVLN